MSGDLVAALAREGVHDADDSTLARALYSTDASLYRVVPQVVVRPRSVDELAATVAVARDSGTPLTMRGAGTSIAGNAVGTGIVVDTTKHLNRVLSIDPEARTAVVEPGTVHATLQRAATAHGLRFGPDPSTHTRCTVGGMIGNNACGSRALGYGRTVDNVVALDVLTADGGRITPEGGRTALHDRLDALVADHLATIRTDFGRFTRQVSGYSLEHLLPERGRDLSRFLVGTEGTLGRGRRRHGPAGRRRALPGAGRARLPLDVRGRRRRPGPAAPPAGRLRGPGLPDRRRGAHRHRQRARPAPRRRLAVRRGHRLLRRGGARRRLRRGRGRRRGRRTPGRATRGRWPRCGGSGRTAPASPRAAWTARRTSGWEDAAVPPERLGDYLRGFDALLRESGLDGVPYGHFGDGCVHVRIDFPLTERGGPQGFRSFVEAAADLTAAHGGSLSGEHGDGRARSELLTRMYSPEVIDLFGAVKHLFDPGNLLNPGVLVDPRPVDADLRLAARLREPRRTLRLAHDGGSVVDAVHRCTGVGKCVADNTGTGGVMCPSYLATRDEKDSTRGRSRVLQEMINGSLVTDGWKSDEVHEALDLCLSCKGCSSDCPTGIDMATYKAEALHQRYRRRIRPRSHYALGQLPRWARLAQPVAPLANRVMRIGAVQRIAKAAAGIDQRRSVPAFATEPLRRWARRTSYAASPRHRTTTSCSGRTRSPTGSPRPAAGPPSRCSRRPACGSAWSPSPPAAG